MEIKVDKQSICIKEPGKWEQLEHPIDCEVLLPDSYPNIARILKCTAAGAVATSKRQGDNTVLEGEITVTVIYISDDGGVCFYNQSLPLYHEVPLPEGHIPFDIHCKTEYCNCRLVNDRKVELHGAMNIHLLSQCVRSCGVITGVNDPSIQLLCDTKEITTLAGVGEKNCSITDEIQVPAGNVRTVLRYKARVCNGECKPVTGKVVVKGDLEVYALYQTTDGGFDRITGTIPFTQLVELDDADETCGCTPTFRVCHLELRPRTGLDGECRNIMVSATIHIQVEGIKAITLPVITDCFSTKCQLNTKRQDGYLQKECCRIHQSHIEKKQLEMDRSLESVIDLWCTDCTSRASRDEGMLTVSGVLSLSILAKDTDGVPLLMEKTVEYDWQSDRLPEGHYLTVTPRVEPDQFTYTLTGANTMDVRASLTICGTICDILPYQPLVELSEDEDSPLPAPPAPLVIYYAGEGEAIFDIARRYHTTCDAILSANQLTDSTVHAGPLLIPTSH